MKVCITAQGPGLEARAEERFGRAPYFVIIDTMTGAIEAQANQFAEGAGGVGPKAAQLLLARKIDVLISGQVGLNAREVLAAAGVVMYTYSGGGTVGDAFRMYSDNQLKVTGS